MQNSGSLTNPAQLAAQIRFHLGQLSAHNGHHEFEKLCFWLTKERLCRDVLPATGPVSSGGDQGRDFETFRTFLSTIVEREEYFAGIDGSASIAFACSLDKEFAQKIRSDVGKILGGGSRVGTVVFFAGCDIPVAKRHELEAWAENHHSVKLHIHDAQALAVLLGEKELWWIAQEYLKIPEAVFPRQVSPERPPESATASTAVASELTMALLNEQMAALSAVVGKTRLAQIDDIRESLRSGRAEDALRRIRDLKQDADWKILPKEVKAKVCHLEANLLMATDGSLDEAAALVNEGSLLDPALHPQFLHGRIAFYRDGVKAALAVVETPATLDAWNLRVSLLIEDDQLDAAEAQFANPPANFSPDHETARLRTMAALLRGDLDEARKHIAPALAAHPTWFSLRYAAALVDYFSIFAPGLVHQVPKSWPAPTDPAFLRRDEASIVWLAAAETTFRELAAQAQLGLPLRRLLEGWRLACLGGDLTRRDEACDYCAQLLASEPDHMFALVWAQARGFSGNLSASIDALRAKVDAGEADTETCSSLFSLLNSRGDVDALAEVVARTEPLFSEKREVWQFWAAEVHVARGQIDEALASADAISDVGTAEVVRRLALRARWQRGGSPEPLLTHLKKQFAACHTADFLYELCELHSHLSNWKAVAEHADDLVRMSGSVASVRLAAAGAWNAHDHRLCLRLLRENQNLFPESQLPPDLERHAVLCETQCGMFDAALAHARHLASRQSELQNVALQFNVEVARGDLRAAALTARAFKDDPQLPMADLLRAAKLVRHVDAATARELLSAAVARGARDPQSALDALVLSHDLGLRHVVPQLETFLHQRLESGELRLLNGDEVREQAVRHMASVEEAIQEHARGEVTVHVLGNHLPRPMAEIFHRSAAENRSHPDPLQQEPVFAWHGGRESQQRFFAGARLHLDLTALLAAADLDILGLIEAHLAPLYLAPAIPHCLLQQLEKTQNAGATRASSIQAVLRLHDARTIANNTDEAIAVRSFEEIHYALGRLGMLTEGEMVAPVSAGVDEEISRGSVATLAPGVAELLAADGLLDRAATTFHLRLPTGEHEAMSAWLREHERTVHLHDWINHLRERISRSGGPYDFFAVRYRDAEALPEAMSPDLACLFQISSIEEKDGALLWSDDRFLNGFSRCSGIPTVTLLDVLGELHARGALSESEHFAKLHLLRASNARYVPVARAELLHHLRRAHVVDGEIVETPELTTLRRYYAACLLDPRFQRPAPSKQRPPMGEVQLFADLYLATSTALLALWAEPSGDFADAEARATWLLTSLWQDAITLVGTFSDALAGGLDDGLFGLGLAHLVMQGVSLPGRDQWPRTGEANPRQLYLAWLERTFSFTGRERRRTLAEALRRDFEDRGWLEGSDERMRLAQREILGTFFDELPRSIRDAIPLSRDTLRLLGLERFTATHIDELQFEYRAFWRSAGRAWNGRPTRIRPQNTDVSVSIAIEEGRGDISSRLVFTRPDKPRRGVHVDPILVLLDRDPLARRRLLEKHRDWFDCAEEDFQRHAARIASLRSTHERIRQATTARAESPAFVYGELKSELGRGNVGEKPFLPPPLKRMLAYLRLRLDGDPNDATVAIGEAAAVLLRELGFEEAIYRLSSLPIPLPEPVLHAFDSLPFADAESLLARLEIRLQQPFARLLLARLSLRNARRGAQDPSDARRLVTEILNESSAPRFDAFLAIARWAARRIAERDASTGALSGAVLAAAWLHATEVFNAITAYDPHWEGLRDSFNDRGGPRTDFFFAFDEPCQTDAAHPRSLDRVSTIIHACVATVLAEDPSVASDFAIDAFARAGFFVAEGERRTPQLSLREEPSSLLNAIGSFLGADRGAALAAAVGAHDAAAFRSEAWHEQIREAISGAQNQPVGTGHWTLLSLYLATRPAPKRFHQSLGDLLRTVSLPPITEGSAISGQVLLIFCARQGRDLSGEVALHIKAELTRLAQKIATQPALIGSEDAKEWATMLVEAARILAFSEANEIARARAFAEITNSILRVWPACSAYLRRTVTFLSFRLPPRQSAELRVTRSLVLAQGASE